MTPTPIQNTTVALSPITKAMQLTRVPTSMMATLVHAAGLLPWPSLNAVVNGFRERITDAADLLLMVNLPI